MLTPQGDPKWMALLDANNALRLAPHDLLLHLQSILLQCLMLTPQGDPKWMTLLDASDALRLAWACLRLRHPDPALLYLLQVRPEGAPSTV